MTLIWVDSDPHGIEGIVQGEKLAMARGISVRICCGDIWDANHARRIQTHYIRGNHERNEYWSKERDNVVLHSDYSTFLIDDVKFGVLGRKDPDEVSQILKNRPDLWLGHASNRSFVKRDDAASIFNGCDVLLFHESPHPFVGNGWIGGSQYLTDILERVQPKLVFHGDMHQLSTRRWKGVEIIGLPPIDPEYYQQGWAVLDTETLKVSIETQVQPNKKQSRNV